MLLRARFTLGGRPEPKPRGYVQGALLIALLGAAAGVDPVFAATKNMLPVPTDRPVSYEAVGAVGDGLIIDDRNHPEDYQGPYLFMDPDGAKPKAGAEAAAFPYRLTEQVTIRNLTTSSGRKLQTSPDSNFAKRVRVIEAN